jgi:hypothetical protein
MATVPATCLVSAVPSLVLGHSSDDIFGLRWKQCCVKGGLGVKSVIKSDGATALEYLHMSNWCVGAFVPAMGLDDVVKEEMGLGFNDLDDTVQAGLAGLLWAHTLTGAARVIMALPDAPDPESDIGKLLLDGLAGPTAVACS